MGRADPSRIDLVFAGRLPIRTKSEGLFVMMCDLVRPLIEDGASVVIHTTDRHESGMRQALEGNGISLACLTLRVHRLGSISLGWLDRPLMADPKAPRKRSVIRQGVDAIAASAARATRAGVLWLSDVTAATAVWRAFALLLLASVIVVAVLLVLPVVAFATALTAAMLVARRTVRWLLLQVRSLRLLRPLRIVLSAVRRSYVKTHGDLANHLYMKEQQRFAAALDRDGDFSTLLFFTCFEGHLIAALRKKRRLVVFPDAVVGLYASRFPYAGLKVTLDTIRLAVASADALVCYSEFVRDTQLHRYFMKEASGKRTAIIPQGHALGNSATSTMDRSSCHQALNSERDRIENMFPELMRSAPHVRFEAFDYVLYPTVDRQHKNTLTVARAVEHLLRQRFRNVKLILTTPQLSDDVRSFAYERRLQYDIIVMPSVPIETLEMLFRGAALAVHASLAEGGFPFTFSRAVTLGTPALLADVEVVREALDRDGIDGPSRAPWLFDPADYWKLADRIEWTLDHREELLASQQSALARMGRYDFRQVARRYVDIYESL